MLLRLMGFEQEALSSNYSHPFTDTLDWDEPYIAYAYHHGLTNGISATQFAGKSPATAPMYITFVLRALGYADSGSVPDFVYADSVAYGEGLGLFDKPFSGSDGFVRGDVAVISKNALSQPLRNSEQTLYERLLDGRVLDNTAYWNTDKTVLHVPAESSGKHWEAYTLFYHTLVYSFPETAKILFKNNLSSRPRSNQYSDAEIEFIEVLSKESSNQYRSNWGNDNTIAIPASHILYLVDSSYNILAQCTTPEAESDESELTFITGVSIDGAKLNKDYRKVVDTVAQNWDKNQIELGEERYAPWDDGSGVSYVRPIKINGSYVSDGWYSSSYTYSPGYNWDHPIEVAEQAMTSVFFFSDKSLGGGESINKTEFESLSIDELIAALEAQDIEWSNINFSELYYPSIDEPGAPATRGFRFYEHNDWDRVIYFFTRDGVYLGRTFVPAG